MKVRRKKLSYSLIVLLIFTFLYGMMFHKLSFIHINIEQEKEDDAIEDYNREFNIKPSIYQEWNRTGNGTGDADSAGGVVVDTEGNIYCAGTNGSHSTSLDMILYKYNSSGVLEWTRSWNGERSDKDLGNDVAVDSENNVYIVGKVRNRGTGSSYPNDMQVVKYNSTGHYQWNRSWYYNSSDSMQAYGVAIDVDSNDNIYIGCDSYSSLTPKGMAIVKYDKNGIWQWNETFFFDGFDTHCNGIAIDNLDNAYIVGYNGSSTKDGVIVKYNHTGHHQWNKTFDNGASENINDIAIDNDNTLYLGGYSYYSSAYHMMLLKYDSDGNYINQINYSADSIINRIAIDKRTELLYFIGGDPGGFMDPGDLIMMAVNYNGDYFWNLTLDTNCYEEGYKCDIYYDTSGILYVARQHNADAPYYQDLFLAKYPLSPGSVTLSTNATAPYDLDGIFNLTWTTPLPDDVNNYTVYNYSKYITEINNSLGINAEEIEANELSISGLTDGTYYYILVAYNSYGNSTSNCVEIKVGLPPGQFELSENATKPYDTDGNFWLNWSSADRAVNYSIYYSASEITDIGSATLYAEGITANKSQVSLSSGLWYLTVIAKNTYGISYANKNITVNIGLIPSALTLNALFAGTPDTDGIFTLDWLADPVATHYSLYWSTHAIPDYDINSTNDVYLLYNGTDTEKYTSGWTDGTYYFKVFAFNQYGNSSSLDVSIIVQIPGGSDSLGDFSWIIQALLTGAISASVGILIKLLYSAHKRRKELKDRSKIGLKKM